MNRPSALADAVSYWERKRLVYNGVLAVLVMICWGADIIAAGPREWLGAALVLLIFATIANALFCLAYPVDLVLQASPFRIAWKRRRWLLFAVGLFVASTLAVWIMLRPGMA